MTISAVVLAAGESRRMGRPKLLLPYGASTILETVLASVQGASIERTIVVLGFGRERIEPRIRRFPVEIVVNPDPGRGMLSSVQAGLAALPSAPGSAFIVPGDHPDLTPAVFAALLAARQASGKGLIVPVFQGRGGHPLLLDLAYREEIFGLDPAVGLRRILELHPEAVLRIPIDEAGVLVDIDTPDDFRRASGRRPDA
jgi:molybdenum cofactor cytidylyltransferase